MRAPRLLQAFIPFQILTFALDRSRSKTERLLYGGASIVFILIATSVTLQYYGVGLTMSVVLRLIGMAVYLCILISILIVGGRKVFRMGKAAQGLSKAGYHTLGVLFIFCGILLILVGPYIVFTGYS